MKSIDRQSIEKAYSLFESGEVDRQIDAYLVGFDVKKKLKKGGKLATY